ncbi:MAG: hypothetical protein WDZ91_04550 [Paenibacillaceae bacterium]
MNLLLFVIFGTFEVLAMYYLCCALFRFNAKSYLIKFSITQIPILLVNYLIRLEDPISGLAPLFSLIMIILFLRVFLNEVSLLWAAIMGIVSYAIFGVIQTAILSALILANFTTFATIHDHPIVSYFLQISSGLIIYLIAHYLYKRGIGFTFALDRFKLVGENIVIMIILFVFLIAVGIIFYFNDLLIITVVLVLPILYLTYFAIRKQREDARDTTFLE